MQTLIISCTKINESLELLDLHYFMTYTLSKFQNNLVCKNGKINATYFCFEWHHIKNSTGCGMLCYAVCSNFDNEALDDLV